MGITYAQFRTHFLCVMYCDIDIKSLAFSHIKSLPTKFNCDKCGPTTQPVFQTTGTQPGQQRQITWLLFGDSHINIYFLLIFYCFLHLFRTSINRFMWNENKKKIMAATICAEGCFHKGENRRKADRKWTKTRTCH